MTFSIRTFTSFIAVAMLAVLVGCAGAGQRTGQAMDDTAITAKVKTQMATDKDVAARNVSVETTKGVVRLSGFVDNNAERQRAEQIARSVEGVKSVQNGLVVRTQ